MEDSGEVRESIGIVDGAIGIIREPVMQPKMVPISQEGLAELKLQRDQSLDVLSGIAVKEV